MDWYKRFRSKACNLRLKGETKEDVLREAVDDMVSGGVLPEPLASEAVKALLAREQLASTGVGNGVAIPHVRLDGLDASVCVLSVVPEGVEWQAVDGEPVRILFLVLRPPEATDEHDPEDHLEMMRWIARLARDNDFRAFALQAKRKPELTSLLKEMSPV